MPNAFASFVPPCKKKKKGKEKIKPFPKTKKKIMPNRNS